MGGKPTAIDLFCGAGGISQGLSRAGFEVLGGVDSDPDAVETFSRNHDAVGVCCDIQHLGTDSEQLEVPETVEVDRENLEQLEIEREELDLLVGGPPCPTFSSVGRSKIGSLDGRHPDRDERHELYEDFLRFVDHYRPSVFLMENVEEIVSATNDKGVSISEIIRGQMTTLGYRVTVQVIDAVDYGVPQHRRRAFFLGTQLDRPLPDLDQFTTHRAPQQESEKQLRTIWDDGPVIEDDQSTLAPFIDKDTNSEEASSAKSDSEEPWITVAEAILDLPPVSPEGKKPPTTAIEYTLPPLTAYQKWARDVDEEQDGQVLFNHSSRSHNHYDLSLYKLLGEGVGWNIGEVGQHLQPYRQDIFSDKYRKQNPREPASTIVAHLSKDGHMFVHPREARSLTVREAARLQSFRDSFRFPEKQTAAFQLVGNAVPPRLARVLAEAIRETTLED